MSTSKNNYPHKDCDESCYYHCTEGGQHPPNCVTLKNKQRLSLQQMMEEDEKDGLYNL